MELPTLSNVRKAVQDGLPNREFEWIQTRGLHMLPSGAREHDVDVKDRGDAKHKSLVEIVSNELNAESSMIVFCNSMASSKHGAHTS